MNRQYRAIALTDQLLSHTPPMSLFQVFTQEQASNRKGCAHKGCGINAFFCSFLLNLSDNLAVVHKNCLLIYWCMFLQESQQSHKDNQILELDTYYVCIITLDVLDTKQKASCSKRMVWD